MTEVVTVRGAAIRVHVTGDPDRPPVQLLHGIGRSLEDWLPQHDRLSGTHRVLTAALIAASRPSAGSMPTER